MIRDLHIDTSAFNAALDRFLQHSKRDAEVVLRQQAKGLIKSLIAVTPPGGRSVSGSQARGRGMSSVKADTFKVVRGVTPRLAQESNVAAAIKPHRIQGRVHREVTPRILVPMSALRDYLRKQTQKVGHLASGWNQAAARFGFKPPVWIWRNRGPGGVEIEVSDRRIAVRATNRVKYASGIRDMNSLVQWAVNLQKHKLLRQLRMFLAGAGRKAGFKT